MDSARWDRIQTLFHGAVELAPPEQRPFLECACTDDRTLIAEVLSMIEQDSSGNTLLDRDVSQIADQVLGTSAQLPFKRIGPYRILRMLGEGGMGVVYLAQRDDLGNLVALKILRDAWLSPARRERFITEQRTLAQLNHPSIARLYDANTLGDGTPWFVMEYVEGVPLNDYCREHDCSIEHRLKLFRAVCEAVQHAHSFSVIHRDLKPSNILVKSSGGVRLLDFGIAKQLDALGKPGDHTRTGAHLMTPAYAAPEQIRGERTGVHSDVYSLGVILYELLAGRLPFDISQKTPAEVATLITTGQPVKPSSSGRLTRTRTASWHDLDVLCLTAMQKDPERRYLSVDALIRDIDHYLKHEPLEARPDSPVYTLKKFVRRNWRPVSAGLAMLMVVATAVALTVTRDSKGPLKFRPRTVAILPFQNTGADPALNFLRQGIADEIAGTLGYARSLSVRPPESTRKYTASNLDMQRAGNELRVASVVGGHFLKAGEQIQITLEVTDVESDRVIWQDVFDVPQGNMMAMQAQIASKTRRGLAPLLGVTDFVTNSPPQPKNEEAYNLYLRSKAVALDMTKIKAHPEANRQAIEMLTRAVALDPGYAPAWEELAGRYAEQGWFGTGGEAALQRWRELAARIVSLDPENVVFRAGLLYGATLGGNGAERGAMSRGQAFREMQDLVRRRPDSARLHFMVSWLLRDTGLLDESARECDTSVLIDAQDAGARSCGVTFMLRGDYQRALDYLHMDADSEVSKAVSVDVFLRQGKEKEAMEVLAAQVPQWAGYDMLQAYLEHRPAPEVRALARALAPAPDPEVNYFSAAHLAYSGQTDAALAMLKRTIQGAYCSYPAVDTDPIFANLRDKPGFSEIRAAALACQQEFLAKRAHPAQ